MEYFDAKSNERPPLLSDDALVELTYVKEDGRRPSEQVRDFYEAARAKDAELIQQLVDEVAEWMQPNLAERFRGEQWHQSKRILDAAAAAGFKPTEP
jgi:hypothetical protein